MDRKMRTRTYNSEQEVVVRVSSVPDRCECKTLEFSIDESLIIRVAVVQSEAA